MLNYKQRYKPRTQREYTKTDLTVYDSAGNTALAGLKVYGKSEVVDGEIVSAGEGYAVVRLADLTWTPYNTIYYATISNKINNQNNTGICPSYNVINSNVTSVSEAVRNLTDNNSLALSKNTSTPRVYIRSDGYSTVEDFVASLGDATLCYQLADPTQGNTIAIKTDNGTGINGTMATFTTGTPLYGISDTIRDAMQWDGSAGEVTKNCASVDLGTLTWYVAAEGDNCFYTLIPNTAENLLTLTAKYTKVLYSVIGTTDKAYCRISERTLVIHDSDFTTPQECKAGLTGVMLIYELATSTSEQLTQAENTSIASLRTFDGTTHFTNNAATDMGVSYTIKVPTIS